MVHVTVVGSLREGEWSCYGGRKVMSEVTLMEG